MARTSKTRWSARSFPSRRTSASKPIEYHSARDGIFVTVRRIRIWDGKPYGDADILIWAASVVCDQNNRKINDIPRKLHFQPYDLLKAIGRGTSGAQYTRLREALERLRSTDIRTNIRAPRGKKESPFRLDFRMD